MPKATRGSDSPTPKKRSRKTTSAAGNGAAPENGTSVQVVQAVPPSPEVSTVSEVTAVSVEVQPMATIEEQIRVRAYELYLQRASNGGGSPEQDWLRAQQEICGQ